MTAVERKSRKRRWDQDAQGEPAATPEESKAEGEIQKTGVANVSLEEIAAKINASLASKGVSIEKTEDMAREEQLKATDSAIREDLRKQAEGEAALAAKPEEPSNKPNEISLTETLGLDTAKTSRQPDDSNYQHHAVIDINDTRHRYHLTKASTQEELENEFGVSVKSKGKYYPDRRMATEKDPALCLEVAAPTQEALDKASERIKELIEKGPAVPASVPAPNMPSLITDKVFLDLDFDRISAFNLRGKILGPQGSYLKHIQTQSNCKVHLRGRGSGYVEIGNREENPEGLHLHVSGLKQDDVDLAKQLSQDLLMHVKKEVEASMAPKPLAVMPGYPTPYPTNKLYGYPPNPYYPGPQYPMYGTAPAGYPAASQPQAPPYPMPDQGQPQSPSHYPYPPAGSAYPTYPSYSYQYGMPQAAYPYPPPGSEPPNPSNQQPSQDLFATNAQDSEKPYNNAPPPPTYKHS